MGLLRSIAARFATIDRRPAPVIYSHSELGKYGEAVALAVLQRRGCKLLTRNFRTRGGELDLICLDGKILCFVEVKTRHGKPDAETHPADAVHFVKQQRTIRAAQQYLLAQGNPQFAARFDVVEVIVTAGQVPECRVIVDAYRC